MKDCPGVYALGDFANIAGADGKPLPQLVSVAEQSGKWCEKNIAAVIAGEPQQPSHYLDKGIMAMIGRNLFQRLVNLDLFFLGTGAARFKSASNAVCAR